MAEASGDMSGLVIDAVFSLADSPVKSMSEEHDNKHEGNQTSTPMDVVHETKEQDIEHLLSNSPVPIKKCSVRMNNFIEKDVRNKITEACNNAIVKQEPGETTESDQTLSSESIEAVAGDQDEQPRGRPARKRKPNSLLSSEFLYKNKEIAEFQKMKNRKKPKEVTCQIDHDLVMTVAEKCLPEVVEKTEHKEDIKMVSILPPTLQININDTPVVIDWQEKIKIPEEEVKYSRPQTARTKKKLRTQEQIDKDYAEKRKKSKLKPKSKEKKKHSKTDPSPPHLEPYGGEFLDHFPSKDTPGSPGGLPPQLKPYEIGVNDAYKQKVNTPFTESSMPLLTQALTSNSYVENQEKNRIPCSLTGRMRKPNQQFGNFLVSEVTKGARPSPKAKQVEKVSEEQNTTINHENNTVYVTTLPNNGKHTDISSKTIPNIYSSASQYMDLQKSAIKITGSATTSLLSHKAPTQQAATGTTSNTKLTNAIGELAKIENTKKFFQLVVGDKIVLIPTDGNNVVPKAFVMDLAASQPGSQIAQSAKAKLPATEQPASKTFFMNVAGKPTTQVCQTETVCKVQSSQAQPGISQNLHSLQNQQISGNGQNINKVIIQSFNGQNILQKQQIKSPHHPNILQRPIVSPQLLNYRITGSKPGTKVILPIVSNIGENKANTPPTQLITNGSVSSTTTFSPAPQSNTAVSNSQNINTASSSSWSNVSPSIGTKVKTEPDNIKDYEKAVKAFKGVPDNDSETESDNESKKTAENERPKVPEVGSHVPASESATAEKIRKLKEKLRQQQMEVENLRKNYPAKDDENDTSS